MINCLYNDKNHGAETRMEKLQNTKEPSRDPERMKYRLSEAMKECMKYAAGRKNHSKRNC